MQGNVIYLQNEDNGGNKYLIIVSIHPFSEAHTENPSPMVNTNEDGPSGSGDIKPGASAEGIHSSIS